MLDYHRTVVLGNKGGLSILVHSLFFFCGLFPLGDGVPTAGWGVNRANILIWPHAPSLIAPHLAIQPSQTSRLSLSSLVHSHIMLRKLGRDGSTYSGRTSEDFSPFPVAGT